MPEGVHTTVSRPRYDHVRPPGPHAPRAPRLSAVAPEAVGRRRRPLHLRRRRVRQLGRAHPDVTTQVGASHTALGLALLCVSIGALASMQLAGALCARLGAGLVATASALLICVAVTLPGLARTLPELAAALLAFGAATGAVNVAANSAGVRIEAAGSRPIMPGLHAAFSFGGLVGAALGGLASGLGPVAPHLLVVAGVGLLLTRGDRAGARRWRRRAAGRRHGGVERADALADSPEPKRTTTAPRSTARPARPDRRAAPPTARARSPTGARCTCARPWRPPRPSPPPGTRRSHWRWPAVGWWAGGLCGPSGPRTSSSTGRCSPRPACSPPPSPRPSPWPWSGSRSSGWAWRTSSRSRSPAPARSAGRRGWPWRRRWVTRACSAARP